MLIRFGCYLVIVVLSSCCSAVDCDSEMSFAIVLKRNGQHVTDKMSLISSKVISNTRTSYPLSTSLDTCRANGILVYLLFVSIDYGEKSVTVKFDQSEVGLDIQSAALDDVCCPGRFVTGLVLADGQELRADSILCNAYTIEI